MGYLKYYSDENLRHPVAEAVRLDFLGAVRMSQLLFTFFNIPDIRIVLLDKTARRFQRVRKTQSWYRGGFKPEIVYHPGMLSALTIAHEVAHYVHDLNRKKIVIKTELINGQWRRTMTPRENWHGPSHKRYVDQAVAFLSQHKDYKSMFQPGMVGEMARTDQDLKNLLKAGVSLDATPTDIAMVVNSFFASLPEKLTCPCCSATLPKSNFGVRVMKKNAHGLPIQMRRQSYCRACR